MDTADVLESNEIHQRMDSHQCSTISYSRGTRRIWKRLWTGIRRVFSIESETPVISFSLSLSKYSIEIYTVLG